jgi:hypothetical protein
MGLKNPSSYDVKSLSNKNIANKSGIRNASRHSSRELKICPANIIAFNNLENLALGKNVRDDEASVTVPKSPINTIS